MNLTSWLLLMAACASMSGLTWWATAWWYRRKLAEMQRKLEKTRKVASVHTLQARHRISKLQRELAASQSEIAAHQKIHEAWKSLQTQPGALSPPSAGFADTQPL
jgi:hypothetical protein